MSFKVFILAGDVQHPEYTFDTDDVEVPLQAIRDAIRKGYIARREQSTFSSNPISVVLKIGPGTIFRLIDEKAAREVATEQRMRSVHLEHGLISAAPEKKQPYSIVIQHGMRQVEPDLDFDSFEEAETAVADALQNTGYFEHTITEGSDYLFLTLDVGQVYMILSKEDADARRRMLIEMRMREAQQRMAQQGGGGPKLIIPGS